MTDELVMSRNILGIESLVNRFVQVIMRGLTFKIVSEYHPGRPIVTSDERAADSDEPTYRSGIAARLAGIPVETLRVWERRYRVVGPRKSPRGHRLYSAEDVRRLALIRQLVELGSPIGVIAALPLAALGTMRAAADRAPRGIPGGLDGTPTPIRVAAVGDTLPARLLRESAVLSQLEIVATSSSATSARENLRGIAVDVLAFELPTLQPEAIPLVDAVVEAVGARHAIVAYRYAPEPVLDALRRRGHQVVRAPLDMGELERLSRDAIVRHSIASSPPGAVAGRRFDDQSLIRLSQALTTLYCECPRHVVELLQGLISFERYSAECADRSPADAVLHRYLERVAGSARVLFEDALVRVARSEGLALQANAGVAVPGR
jgi:DNA-binding transcriptional MerR regulator